MFKVILLSVLSLSVAGQSRGDAEALYAKRGETENGSFAKSAADMYGQLAASESDSLVKGNLLWKQSEALYYFGNQAASKEEKKTIFDQGTEIAKSATELIQNNGGTSIELASARYFHAVHVGKWAEANGILASLFRWPEINRVLQSIEAVHPEVQDWGANRTRARVYHKKPGESKRRAQELLAEAFDNTLNEDFGLSRNSTTVLYYMDILAKRNKADPFCEIYENFESLFELSDEELEEYSPGKVPETKVDLKLFEEGTTEEDLHDFYDSEC